MVHMCRPISVLLFSNSAVRGGAEEHILTLVRNLDRQTFRLQLVCSPQCTEKMRPDVPPDVSLIPMSLEEPYHIGAATRFARLLKELGIDILHSHMFRASFAASPVAWLCGVPVVIETPHVREAWRRGAIKGRYLIDRIAGRFVDHYIAVSQANAVYLIKEKRLPPEKVHVIQNGCDLEKFDPERAAPADLKQALGFGQHDPVLLVLGRLEPQKGHRFLLEAHSQIVREFPRARLVCVGEGMLRQELEREVMRLRIQNNVLFVGFHLNVADWLALADISVLPSLYEGLPLVAIESLAAQRPMVATAVDGTIEVIVNGKTGLTVPPGNPQELAAAILRLLREPDLSHQLARAGRQWVVEHFSQQQQIRKTQELYVRAWETNCRRAKRAESARSLEMSHECERTNTVVLRSPAREKQ